MNLYRKIPKIDKILENEMIKKLLKKYKKFIIKKFIDKHIDNLKNSIKNNRIQDINEESIIDDICKNIAKDITDYFQPQLKKVINATGIVLHTNFGRAPLSENILNNVSEIAGNYSNLEFNLSSGSRGIRYQNLIKYFQDLTNCEDVLIVNNNAAAVLLALTALAKEKEVIISRGELIEIGGSFRIPEVMEQSGAILREVGATNKTHLKDYKNAINENTGLILKAHTSNYRIIGFSQLVDIEELVKLGKEYNIPVMFDLGSGSLIDMKAFGLPDEPTVQSIINKDVDILSFSGDKLLGGPQAGIILGKKIYIDLLKKHPLNRALRIDKFTLSALEVVIKSYFQNNIFENILSLKLINESLESLKEKANNIVNLLNNTTLITKIEKDFSYVGGGAFPMNKIPTIVITLEHPGITPSNIEQILRNSTPPIIGRIKNNTFMLDVRTILNNQIEELTNVILSNFK